MAKTTAKSKRERDMAATCRKYIRNYICLLYVSGLCIRGQSKLARRNCERDSDRGPQKPRQNFIRRWNFDPERRRRLIRAIPTFCIAAQRRSNFVTDHKIQKLAQPNCYLFALASIAMEIDRTEIRTPSGTIVGLVGSYDGGNFSPWAKSRLS
jgi:hypothetical protein